MSKLTNKSVLKDIKTLLQTARQHLQQTVNTTMVQTYWNIGRLIVEDELGGRERAEYGKKQLEQIAETLTQEFGKGFDITNLRKMRQFYQTFPMQDSVRLELSWTHYRRLMRIENRDAREWYIAESIENNWSARALERQVSKLYYERLLSSKEKLPLKQEVEEKTKALQVETKEMLRDPYIFDFLNLPDQTLFESDIEQSLIDNLQQFLLS